ncbi:TPM domain-containing protein [Treponema sp.]|uniref:TPM domain-containing protein n=1 Tax=Treponema sp. TaxID=166 RepID=UPI00298DE68E|nr:TPM domain-containing protein [Treponema sp.]MCQ2241536.1 TPM domain-containing protein [Treponema sp.]
MTAKQLNRRLNLSESDLEKIKDAVRKAEDKTSGEIALAVTAESSSYAEWELIAAAVTALALFLCVFPMSSQIYAWLETRFWGIEPWYLSLFYAGLSSIAVVVLYFLYNIPVIDALVIPVSVKNRAVTHRALRHFTESGVYCTDNHSGILIFVSWFEKQVRIVADRHISEKVSEDLWNIIADEIAENMAKGSAREAFVSAVEKCGQLLEENFPSEGVKKNQLYDGLVILED